MIIIVPSDIIPTSYILLLRLIFFALPDTFLRHIKYYADNDYHSHNLHKHEGIIIINIKIRLRICMHGFFAIKGWNIGHIFRAAKIESFFISRHV